MRPQVDSENTAGATMFFSHMIQQILANVVSLEEFHIATG